MTTELMITLAAVFVSVALRPAHLVSVDHGAGSAGTAAVARRAARRASLTMKRADRSRRA